MSKMGPRRVKRLALTMMAGAVMVAASSCQVPGDTNMTLPGTPGAITKTVRYGPFTIPAAPVNPDGTHGEGMLKNQFKGNLTKPCTDCLLTSMQANLTYQDGSVANVDKRAMLHHAVIGDLSRSDITCPGGLFGFVKTGERFFASGNERTKFAAPNGYGYPVDTASNWQMIYDLMNAATTAQTVYIDLTVGYVPKTTPGMKTLKPVWMDVDQCGDSEVPAKTGVYDYQYTWDSTLNGRIIGMGGHLHDSGTVVQIFNDTKGYLMCNSTAKYGETPGYIDHHGMPVLSSMTVCVDDGTSALNAVAVGDKIRIKANYDTTLHMAHGDHPVMGIAPIYVATQ